MDSSNNQNLNIMNNITYSIDSFDKDIKSEICIGICECDDCYYY